MEEPKVNNSAYIERASREVKQRLSVNDLISRLVNLTDGIEKAENNVFEALFDAYFLYFPEAASLLKERDKFVDSVKDNIPREKQSSLLGIDSSSMGYEMSEVDLKLLGEVINSLTTLKSLSKTINSHMDSIIKTNYPNLHAVAGTIVAARLILLCGGVKQLSYMPTSKIQVLGAEKGLFTKSKKTPKYGVIYHHVAIESASQNKRGRIARIVASFISLAAKIDYFSKKDESGPLLEKMNLKIRSLK